MKQDLLTFKDWPKDAIIDLLALATDIKSAPQNYCDTLKGKSIVALFEKPSLRTRVSFDIGIHKLGGHLVYLDSQAGKLAGREDARDMGANLSCWADAIVARVYSHNTLLQMAESAKVPVINALCDLYHPCQAIADFLCLTEQYDNIQNVTLAYIGDGNYVTHSLLLMGAILGTNITVVTPPGYEADDQIIALAKQKAQQSGAVIAISTEIDAAIGANVLYTDTWLSMGDDTPIEQIKTTFSPYMVNEEMMQLTGADYVMHCQPAHRDLEITSSLIDGEKSLLMAQAENRMHGQNAILTHILGNGESRGI